ncbi:MAG: cell wall hydrolase [Candidatus Riflebacteria bacterium]|nr:cell wall hydrolase [Candidatus Riflebacteria bacterium]
MSRTGRIIEPKDGSIFGFGEKIHFRAEAFDKTSEGNIDISNCIEWRKPCKMKGPVFSTTFNNREFAKVAIYVNGTNLATVKIKIICRVSKRLETYNSNESLMARVILAEAMSCNSSERIAIGYVVANRFRFFPKKFGSDLSTVIYKPGQFTSIKSDLFINLGSSEYIADKLTYKECQIYIETLMISRKILEDKNSDKDPLLIKTRQHGFFFNKASNSPPDLKRSPLILSKVKSGFMHSFYGYNPNA